MHLSDDQYYIKQISNGKTEAFTVLVNQYKTLVFTLAYKMLKNREQAEEIAQDTFVKAYQSLNKFKGDSKFSTWLYKITYNACLDFLKRNKKEDNMLYFEEISAYQTKAIEDSLDNMVEQERQQKIETSLALLPSEDAFLLTLYYFDNQSLAEISKIIDTNTNNVKIKLHRSRKKLASILNAQFNLKN